MTGCVKAVGRLFGLCLFGILLGGLLQAAPIKANDKLIVAHRGASAYVPEHTLESKLLAAVMGADFVEQDIVMSKDDHLIVIHDIVLDQLTDVEEKFPDRKREDGRYYVFDFTLEELRSLDFTEPFVIENGMKKQKYPKRFPMQTSFFKIHTLEEEIEFVQGINKTLGSKLGKEVGIYVETKAPWLHKQEGKDISLAVLKVLKKYGYDKKDSKVYFQSLDYPDLVRVKKELLPMLGMDIKLLAGIVPNEKKETYELKDGKWVLYDFNYLLDPKNFKEIAKVADAFGVALDMVLTIKGNKAMPNDFMRLAKKAGIEVFPYTARSDALPPYVKNMDELLDLMLNKVGVTGLFIDFPDLMRDFTKGKPKG